jgi:N utilization substance protein B
MAFKRRVVREKVLQVLYAYELSHEPIDFLLENIAGTLRKERETLDFARQLILKVVESAEEIDGMIRQRVEHWEFNRLAVIDKIILRMGICELLYFEDIPPKVTINEAIEIARRYSTEKSDKFVNGVLDSILNDLKANGKLKKSGRGLLDIPHQKKTSKP